ncbi:MAG: hypothetical protein LBP79_04520 [Clostridiales bacterium]|jgi:spermidine/putrescine-binding protein|nr:hypothetical protein [Clostridiales bacterium]
MKKTIKHIAVTCAVITGAATAVCGGVFGEAAAYAQSGAISKAQAETLAGAFAKENGLIEESVGIFIRDTEYDMEIELFDIKSSYIVYEVELLRGDGSRVFIDVNASTGACALRKIRRPY